MTDRYTTRAVILSTSTRSTATSRKHGGSDALANLALAHRSCNQAKGAASYRHPLDSADKPDDRDDYQHEQQDPDDPAAADRDIRETHGDSVAIVPDVTRAAAP